MPKTGRKKLLSKVFSQLDQPTLKRAMEDLTHKRKLKIGKLY